MEIDSKSDAGEAENALLTPSTPEASPLPCSDSTCPIIQESRGIGAGYGSTLDSAPVTPRNNEQTKTVNFADDGVSKMTMETNEEFTGQSPDGVMNNAATCEGE